MQCSLCVLLHDVSPHQPLLCTESSEQVAELFSSQFITQQKRLQGEVEKTSNRYDIGQHGIILRPPRLSKKHLPRPLARCLTYFSARGDIVRATNLGAWSTARPRWTLLKNWLGDVPEWCSAAEGYRELVHRWLRTFGPGTEEDIDWWLGSTKAAVRTALAELAAVEVSLDHGDYGWILPDQIELAPDPGPWVALLPTLDPTVMGWRTRRFYLDRHRDHLFDNNGNVGTTVWFDGRVVGYWVQDQSSVLQLQLLERVSAHAQRHLASEAKRLTEWLGGLQLATVFRFRGRDI